MRLCIISLLNSPHHGRPKTVENKGSNVRYNKINITLSDWVKVENIIPRNVIINRGAALFGSFVFQVYLEENLVPGSITMVIVIVQHPLSTETSPPLILVLTMIA